MINDFECYDGAVFSDSYVNTLRMIMEKGMEKSPRGEKIKFFQNFLFYIENPCCVYSCDSRPYQEKYLNDELKLYFSGTLSVDEFSKGSKFWKKLVNPDGKTINSNYGYLLFYKEIQNEFDKIKNQWTYVKNQLIHDKDTRQALAFISSPHVQFEGNKDFICTLNYIFSINDNKLNLTVNRRSQDMILGIVYDYAWEYLLMMKMHNELHEIYPELGLGSYTMFCANIHIYERNWELVNKMIDDYDNGRYKSIPITNIVDKDIMKNYVYNKEFGN